MTIEQRFKDAVATFTDLIAEGRDTGDALERAAAEHSLKADVLSKRMTKNGSIDDVVKSILAKKESDRFITLVTFEVKKCKSRKGIYGNLDPLFGSGEDLISEEISRIIGRLLTDHEKWIINDRLDPTRFELNIAMNFRLKPLRHLSDI